VAQLFSLGGNMNTFDNSALIMSGGLFGFTVMAVFSGLAFWVSGIGARRTASSPRHIYFARLAFMFGFLVVLWGIFLPFAESAHRGNALDPVFWSHIARDIGIFYGAQTFWAWFIIALLEWPRKKQMPPNKSRACVKTGGQ
jgi:hypothetical protein